MNENSVVKDKKKIPAEKRKKKESSKDALIKGAIVQLTDAYGQLKPGRYEIGAFNPSGDPILKTEKGLIGVPLELIEPLEPGKKTNPAPVQMEMGDANNPFTMDRLGQITIKDLDTPLGKIAKNIIAAQREIRKLEDQMVEDNEVMMKEMKRLDKKVVVVQGYKMEYQAPKETKAKLVVKELE